MNTEEEKLWNYIDGTCTPDEQEAISRLIENDEAFKSKYQELLLLNNEFAALELDVPPMAFTYNVMETIRNEYAAVPLKAAIDKRIIRGIGLFFVITISAILIFALSQLKFSISANAVNAIKFTLPNLSPYLHGAVMQGFWFFDVVLALYLVDTYLRRKRLTKANISVQTGGQSNNINTD